ncbi:MAG: alpha/beta hydrolase [Rhizobium sp.]|nr:alpha/beta hydrolase [Rhizobium sp.]
MLDFRAEARPRPAVAAHATAQPVRLVMTEAGLVEIVSIGPENGPTTILITHGVGSVESFLEIALGLAHRQPRGRIVVYSRPGCGQSPALANVEAGDLLVAEASVIIPAIMQALGIRKANLVGHADGAAVAILAASIHPRLFVRIVGIAPMCFADQQFIQSTRELPDDEFRTGLTLRLRATHHDAGATYRRWRSARNALCRTPDRLLDHMGSLKAPLLLIQGLRDAIGSTAQVSRIAARVSNAVKWVLLQQDGHFPQHDNPEQVLDLIEGHLSAADRSASSRPRAVRTLGAHE